MYVYMILTLFLQGVDPNIAVFFATHFLICHSFLDSHLRADLARKAKGGIWREKGRDYKGSTVAQSHSTLSLRLNLGHMSQLNLGHMSQPILVTCHNQSRSHVTSRQPSQTPNTKIPHFQFPTMLQEN